MRVRGFEVALTTDKMVKVGKANVAGVPQYEDVVLPTRGTDRSAGYDFRASKDTVIPSIWNGLSKILIVGGGSISNYVQDAIKYHKSNLNRAENLREAMIKSLENEQKDLFKPTLIPTGVKSYMQDDEVLELFVRSSTPMKFGLILANSTGIIDADYYNNKSNDGEIMFMCYNLFPFDVTIKKGERIGQGIFKKFYIIDNDNAGGERTGGIGSSDEATNIK